MFHSRPLHLLLASLITFMAVACAVTQRDPLLPEVELLKKAKAIHERVIVLDTHSDLSPRNFTAERNYTQRLDTQVNLPKMFEGGLDAVFFSVFVSQTRESQSPDAFTQVGYDRAYKAAVEKFDAIHWLTGQLAADKIELALTSADVRRINAKGKKIALIGVENGYPMGEDIGRVKEFYQRGARYMSLAHNAHNQLSDSHAGERDGWKWNGLSPLGRQVVAEMNRVGLMVDVSHPSKASMMQSVALSKAPIIASHSAVRALCDVSRNMDDEQLVALKKSGGVVQIVAYSSFIKTLKPDSNERKAALAALRKEFNIEESTPTGQNAGTGFGTQSALARLAPERRADYQRRIVEIDKEYPGIRRRRSRISSTISTMR